MIDYHFEPNDLVRIVEVDSNKLNYLIGRTVKVKRIFRPEDGLHSIIYFYCSSEISSAEEYGMYAYRFGPAYEVNYEGQLRLFPLKKR